jgi:hypothetical protein
MVARYVAFVVQKRLSITFSLSVLTSDRGIGFVLGDLANKK